MAHDFVVELTLRVPGHETWFDQQLLPAVIAAGGFAAIDVDEPAANNATDPFIDDGAPWPRVALIWFDTEASLAAWAARRIATVPPGVELTGVAFRRIDHAVRDAAAARDDAVFRYMVRYDDEPGMADFRTHYLDTHHIGLAKLPGLRSLVNYVPLDVSLPGFASPHYLHGNEVGFDDHQAFNRAMESPERSAMRKDFLAGPLPPHSIHFPMRRRRVA